LKANSQSTERPKERAIVAAILSANGDGREPADPLEEIEALAHAAGAEVVGGLVQRRRSMHPRTAFGSGKVAELKELAAASKADIVIIDFDLSPSQGRVLEKEIGVRIVDRTELILDIFVRRARTKQAKLQVELAQAEYMRPRLMRMWTHLERTEGAIGSRGPGETQLETDRRLIQDRIVDLKRRLSEIDARRHREATSREEPLTVSLVGYTNAGKSSLLARLTGADVYIADQLFATLDTRVRQWDLADTRSVLLADTVGFVRNLPHHLVASFHATLEETLNADLLLQVVDAADAELEAHLEAVDDVLGQLGAAEIPRLLVFNKIDRVGPAERLALSAAYPGSVQVSARGGEGIDVLDAAVGRWIDEGSLHLELELPAGEGRVLARLHRRAVIDDEKYEGGQWSARVRILPRHWNGMRAEFEDRGGVCRARIGVAD